MAEQLPEGGLLHNPAAVHHVHRVRHVGHHAEVVGNEDQGGIALPLHGLQHVQDLGLDGHVQGRGGLVGDDQLGVAGEGHGDQHPLAHAAAELVGKIPVPPLRRGHAHQLQCLDGCLPGLPALHAPVADKHLVQLAADGHHRVQGGQRVLEDHGHFPAPDVQHFILSGVPQVPAVELQAVHPHDGGRRAQKFHNRQGGDALAAAALAHDGRALPLPHRQAHALHGADHAGGVGENDLEVLHMQDGLIRHRRRPFPGRQARPPPWSRTPPGCSRCSASGTACRGRWTASSGG